MTPLSGGRLKEIEARLKPSADLTVEFVLQRMEAKFNPFRADAIDLLSHIASLTKPVDGEEVDAACNAVKTIAVTLENNGLTTTAERVYPLEQFIRRLSTKLASQDEALRKAEGALELAGDYAEHMNLADRRELREALLSISALIAPKDTP